MPNEPGDMFHTTNLRRAEERRIAIIEELTSYHEAINEIVAKLSDQYIDTDAYMLYVKSNMETLLLRMHSTEAKINRNVKYVSAKQLLATLK